MLSTGLSAETLHDHKKKNCNIHIVSYLIFLWRAHYGLSFCLSFIYFSPGSEIEVKLSCSGSHRCVRADMCGCNLDVIKWSRVNVDYFNRWYHSCRVGSNSILYAIRKYNTHQEFYTFLYFLWKQSMEYSSIYVFFTRT